MNAGDVAEGIVRKNVRACLVCGLVAHSVRLCYALHSQKMMKLAAVCHKETLKHQQKIQVLLQMSTCNP